jgi:hypothetical protein
MPPKIFLSQAAYDKAQKAKNNNASQGGKGAKGVKGVGGKGKALLQQTIVKPGKGGKGNAGNGRAARAPAPYAVSPQGKGAKAAAQNKQAARPPVKNNSGMYTDVGGLVAQVATAKAIAATPGHPKKVSAGNSIVLSEHHFIKYICNVCPRI